MAEFICGKGVQLQLLEDSQARAWLVEKTRNTPEIIDAFVNRCRQIAAEHMLPPECMVHAREVVDGREQLISKIGLPLPIAFRQGAFVVPTSEELSAQFSLPIGFFAHIGSCERVGAFVLAEVGAYRQRPFVDCALITSSLCVAGDQLVLDWRESVLHVRHLNMLALSYGVLRSYAAYVFVCSEEWRES